MKSLTLNLPSFAFIVATRAALAAGAGLLLSSSLSPRQRRSIGAALVGVGAATTMPAVWSVIRGIARFRSDRAARIDRDTRLIGMTRFPRKADDELVGDEIADDGQLD
jgi:hypothetical protein